MEIYPDREGGMTARRIGLFFGMALISAGCLAITGAKAADEGHATVKDLMLGIVIPASDGVFGVGSKEPKNAMEWEVIEADAMVLAEAGRLLLTGGRAKDQGKWVEDAQKLIDTSLAAAKVAREKNVDKVLTAGDAVYDACDSCHTTYLPERVGN
jgi:hypothetical protein